MDANGSVTLAKSYQPYGEELSHAGSEYSNYGFAGEMTDPTGLIYLRARYYAPSQGRFLIRDAWQGEYSRPLSLNGWMYVEGNPVNRVDPSGRCYGPLSFFRKIPVESGICEHLDQAMFIYAWPGSTTSQRNLAAVYIGGWAFSHSALIVGAGEFTVAGGQAAIIWLTELFAASRFAQQANQACQQLESYLPSLQPPNNLTNIWNQVAVSPSKIDYLLNSPGKDGFLKLGYSFDSLQRQLNTIGESVTPDLLSKVSEYGPRFEKAVEVIGPSGLIGRITTIWQVDQGTNVLRLITAIPEVFK